MQYMILCRRCGEIFFPESYKEGTLCPVCNSKPTVTDMDRSGFMSLAALGGDQAQEWAKRNMIQDSMRDYYISKRLRYHKEQDAKALQEREQEKKKPVQQKSPQKTYIPHCPICGSPDLTKLSALGKVAKIGFFGIFGAGDIGKTYKCNNCGSKF